MLSLDQKRECLIVISNLVPSHMPSCKNTCTVYSKAIQISEYVLFFFPQSAPISILEKHELASMTLDYRKECGRDSVLQSLTTVSGECDDGNTESSIQCDHLLQLESGADIVKAHTEWRPKRAQGEGNMGFFPAESA